MRLPALDERAALGQLLGPEDVEHRRAVDREVARVAERRAARSSKWRCVVLRPRVGLLLEDPVLRRRARCRSRSGWPSARQNEMPGSPDASTSRNGPVEDAVAVAEPVVPVAERLDAVLLRELGLGRAGLGHPQVVEAELGRQGGLLVAREQRPGLRRVGPLGEAPDPTTRRSRGSGRTAAGRTPAPGRRSARRDSSAAGRAVRPAPGNRTRRHRRGGRTRRRHSDGAPG